jgi:hypothetical protein
MNFSKVMALRCMPTDEVQYGMGGLHFRGVVGQRGCGGGLSGARFIGREFQRGYGRCLVRSRIYQKGKGWGWVLNLLNKAGPAIMNTFKSAAPHVIDGAKNFGKDLATAATSTALNTGMQLMDDVIGGENVLNSAKMRLKQGKNELLNVAKSKGVERGLNLVRGLKSRMDEKLHALQSGKGRGRRGRGRGRGQRGGMLAGSSLAIQPMVKKLLEKQKSQSGKGLRKVIRRSVAGARGCVIGKRSTLPYGTIFDRYK